MSSDIGKLAEKLQETWDELMEARKTVTERKNNYQKVQAKCTAAWEKLAKFRGWHATCAAVSKAVVIMAMKKIRGLEEEILATQETIDRCMPEFFEKDAKEGRRLWEIAKTNQQRVLRYEATLEAALKKQVELQKKILELSGRVP